MKENDENEQNNDDEKNNEDEKNKALLPKSKNKPKVFKTTYPLGYQDKRIIKPFKHKKHHSSRSSKSSGSSESIEEEINENYEEDDDSDKIGSSPSSEDSNNKDLLNIGILPEDDAKFNINDDSSSEIIFEEEIISEEIIAQIYKKEKEKGEIEFLFNNNVISPISERIIIKHDTNNLKKKDEYENKTKKERIFKKKGNLLYKYFSHKYLVGKLRIITIIFLCINILFIISTGILYICVKEQKTIFCFEFLEKTPENNSFFLSDLNSYSVVNILLIICFISTIITLIKNQYLQLKQFFKVMSLYFPITLILNIPIYIIGIIHKKYDNRNNPKIFIPIVFVILTFFGIVLMGKALIRAKRHKFKSISSLINISILTSFMTAYECYCFISSICFLLRSYYITMGKTEINEMALTEIILGLLFFLIGFTNITALKDIFFSIIVVIFELGFLWVRKNYSVSLACFNILAMILSFSSVIITVMKYKKKVFNLSHID